MRAFASSFMILYLLFLLIQPCQDVFASGPETASNSAEVTSFHSPLPDEEENTDACSPFCICSCCSISMAYYPLTGVEPPSQIMPMIKKPENGHNDPFLGSYQNSIWQPPKF
ncbi:MAG: hypothetical protein KF685_08635 [Acidobacteria bacterium]|nr:hypothetical protein [Acidobacteriota bacterium]